ncbi:Dual specificity tyrosine-phosphorylation-regulated kinase 1B [Babesia sp. Xinjiang]|uniref:Dual specificity tyrosine-phosphorylation-regulated kinase 1B n=1 Tax=Babesia sp. Xinjiang TaxID=462227 RepID=UPI000A2635E1|nr:Dual specificity tyrosine-phosphorylation-regulated kinase 1B [Babesia sp. Xinjiang]ORM39960.1 Dual specificity tyrosine-phosphorylation-regulated kinase 1B [Babesia sp. Xinjiang]
MEIPKTLSTPAEAQSATYSSITKMPRYTYYLSNYQYLGPSVNHNTIGEDDKSHVTSPKFGLDNNIDNSGLTPGDGQGVSGNSTVLSTPQTASQAQEYDVGQLAAPFEGHGYNGSQTTSVVKGDGVMWASDRQNQSKVCSVDANDELGSASVADDCGSHYSDSSMLFEDQRNLRTTMYVDQPLADKRQRWMAMYASGNVEEFRKKQKEIMDNIARELTADSDLLEFPIRCICVWGETASDGKFDPLYIRVGDVLVNRYHVTEVIGNTAFSVVLRARDERNAEDVCIKISMPDTVSQAIDEINLLKILNTISIEESRGIVQLKDYFYFRGSVFAVLEILGANLYEATRELYNKRKLRLSPGRLQEPCQYMDLDELGWTLKSISKMAYDILTSLKYMHRLGMINCDLKPENIVVNNGSDTPFVKLIDFGSSCYIQERLSDYVQSRSYRAPEVIMGLPYDTQIDIWSLGCVLCELYIQRILFPSDNNATLMASMISLLGVPPVYMLEHKMNSTFMVLPNGNVADLTVRADILKDRQKAFNSDYQSSLRCNISVSNSSMGSVITSHLGLKTELNTTADYDSFVDANESQLDSHGGISLQQNTNITPGKYSIMQDRMLSQCAGSTHLNQAGKGIKLDICDGRSNAKCVRIIEPTRCTIDGMLNTTSSPSLAIFGDFIKGLLQYDPLERLTAETALSHKFITDYLNAA